MPTTTATRPPTAPARTGTEPLYLPLDFVMVRAPLLPIEAYQALSAPQSTADSALPPTASAAPLLRDSRVRRALGVGSASLLDALGREERGQLSKRDAARLQSKLLRYLIRMSTRPTPYGLFAGVALGTWGPQTDLTLTDTAARTRTRPDMEWLLRLIAELEARPTVRQALCLVANPTALIHAGRVVLAERAPPQEKSDVQAVSMRATGVVRRALTLAQRPIPYADLAAQLLAQTPGATPEKVERLLTELWQQTVLLTDLRPPLTISSPAQYVVERLASIPAAADALAQLQAVLDAAAAWDALPPAEAPAAYQRLIAQAYAVVKPTDKEEPPFQVDTALALGGTRLHEAVGAEVARAAELLLRLSPAPTGFAYLHAYRQLFHGRYGHDREVPLLELLDPNVGIGPPNWYSGTAGIPHAKANQRSQVLRDLACRALYEHQQVVELDADLLTRLETWTPTPVNAPPSLDIYAFVAAPSTAALDDGDFQVIIGPNMGALQAGRNLGRFADLLAPDAPAALERAARREESLHPQQVWAELVYMPRKPRSGNVSIRPAVRHYELTLAVSPGVPTDCVIPLGELLVGVRDNRFYLRWPAGHAEVVVTAGHMLNTMAAPAVIRFLSDVNRDGQVLLGMFDWGPAGSFPFLPRVQAGRVVLRPAQWTADKTTLPPEPPEAFAAALDHWRRRWAVPRYIAISFSDNRLILDLDDAHQAEELRAELRGLPEGGSLLLQEVLPALDHVWLQGPEGRYVTELVVSLGLAAPAEVRGTRYEVRGTQAQEAQAEDVQDRDTQEQDLVPRTSYLVPPSPAPDLVPASVRMRPPGSEWLFAKLYCPRPLEDDLIADPVHAFAEETLAAGRADEWFFIRYSDPDPHLRLRFHGTPERLTGDLLPRLCTWAAELMAEGHCLRVAFDTYDREVERYGGPEGTTVAEQIFAADSRAVAALLLQVQDHEVVLDRTTLAVLTVDDLLTGLGLDAPARLAWYKDIAEEARDAVGKDYRERKTLLRALLADPARLTAEPGGAAVASILAARRAALAPLGAQLASLAAAGTLTQPVPTLCRSFVHLHCNRLLGVNAGDERQILGLLLRTREGLDRPKPARERPA